MNVQGLHLLDSCAFTWIFDGATHRFRRLPRDARMVSDALPDWRPYHHLEIDGSRSCFVVALDEAGTHLLRAWIHRDPCGRCAPEREALGDSRRRIEWWKERLKVVDPLVASAGPRHPLRPYGGWTQPDGAL